MRTQHDYRVETACFGQKFVFPIRAQTINVSREDAVYWLYCARPTDGSRIHGVAFDLSEKANNALLYWEPVSSRLAAPCFKGCPQNLTMVAICAPTYAAGNSKNNEAYDSLELPIIDVPGRIYCLF